MNVTVAPYPAQVAGEHGGVSAVPAALLSLLLLTATWFNGAFQLRHWGPVALLALVVAAAWAWWGGARIHSGGARIAVSAIFAFAAWALMSAVWAESADRALTGGARALLYAVLFLVALATPVSARWAARLGGLLMAGVAVIAAITLVLLLGDGSDQFLAGRLDDPVEYRNATACLFALAFWPFVAATAHQAGNPLVRALAFAAALLVIGLAFLTQSRGVVVGLACGGLVALALGPDRLRRSWVALVAFGALAAASDRLLTPYRAFTEGRPESAADIAPAVDALLVLVAAGFTIALAGALLDGGLRVSEEARKTVQRVALAGIALLVPLALAATLAATGNPVTFAKDRFDEFRSLETAAPGESRLSFGGGQRSDLWRIALLELSENPLTGVGEGNYAFRYYAERRTDRNVTAPHSLAFRLLAELGLIGALAFLAFLAGVAGAVARRWRGAPPETRWLASGLLAAGAVVMAQAMVDWIWVIPGLTGLGFVTLGLALGSLGSAAPRASPGVRSAPLRAGVAIALTLAAVGVGVLYLSDVEVRRARAPDASAQQRLDAARTAERLNPWSVTPLYLKAGAHEELGQRSQARRELLEALELEPANFATLGLLGDFELRQRNARAARAWYRRALRLNPRDVGLRKLARRRE